MQQQGATCRVLLFWSDIISQMLAQTRKNVSKGSGRAFLLYGYSTVAIAFSTYLLCRLTNNPAWNFLWFAMFAVWILTSLIGHTRKPEMITYLDKTIGNIWSIIGSLFGITALIIAVSSLFIEAHVMDFRLTMPLAALYLSIGTSLTGIMIKDRAIVFCPSISIYPRDL